MSHHPLNDHPSSERMHDFVDGLLSSAEEGSVRLHVDECAACREDVAMIRETVQALRALPRSATPPSDLWSAIEERIGSGAAPRGAAGTGAGSATVVPFPGSGRRPARRRFSFSGPQLAAAALVVSLFSAATAWRAFQDRAGPAVTAERPTEASGGGPVLGPAARAASTSSAEYDRAIRDLEEIIARGRSLLRPETLTVLERSLSTIDGAMEDVRAALREDPSSELLAGMLVNHQTARMRILRQAATALQARS